MQEALSLWEEGERTRAEILAAVDVAEASLARGEGHLITQKSVRELADGVKHRGRMRLTEEEAPHWANNAHRRFAQLSFETSE